MCNAKLLQKWPFVTIQQITASTQLGTPERGTINGASTVDLIKMGNLDWGSLRLDEVETIAEEKISDCPDIVLRTGDLLLNTRNTPELVGKSAVWVGDRPKAVPDNNVNIIRLRSEADPHFVCAYMNYGFGKSRIRAIAAGSTSVAAIYWKDLSKYRLPLPPLSVQRKISEILRAWDEAIDMCERIIDAKIKCHDHLRHKLISWARWPNAPIGDVVKAVNRPVPTPTSAYRALSIRSHGKGTFHRLIERPEEIDMETVYEVGAADLIVNITFAWEGAIALAKPEDAGLYVSHRFPTFQVNEKAINRDFLGYAVRSRRFFYFLGVASPGGAGRNRVLNKSDFLEIEIPLPPRSEQDRIASILLTGDHEIRLLRAQRDALAKQKRGLMQKLLTGEWRINV